MTWNLKRAQIHDFKLNNFTNKNNKYFIVNRESEEEIIHQKYHSEFFLEISKVR